MEPADLTLRVLQEIRDDQRSIRGDLKAMNEQLTSTNEQLGSMNERFSARFEVIETTLRDLSQQLVMMGRALKVALESRADTSSRLSNVEARLAKLEQDAH